MPRDKDLKRIVRTRMQKTGESYTTARAHIVRTAQESDIAEIAPPAVAPVPDLAAIAGVSDDTMVNRTGRDWAAWVASLDALKADTMSHTGIARIVHEQFGIPSWWTQAVTVGYERIRGLRDRNQRRGGTYEATKSRTFHVSVDVLFDACVDPKQRRRWLTDPKPTVRSATKPRSMRLGWEDGTLIAFWFIEKGPEKSVLSVQHTKLPDRAAADRVKAYWAERLDALEQRLASRRSKR